MSELTSEPTSERMSDTHAYPHGDPSHWSLYRQTTLHTVLAGESIAIDLSQPLSERTAALLAATHGAWFAILTAFNPRFLSEGRTDGRDNLARHAALGAELARRGLAHTEADGHANSEPDHIEKGYLTRCDEATATELSCEFGQDAFFAFDGRHFWILPALERSMNPVRLP